MLTRDLQSRAPLAARRKPGLLRRRLAQQAVEYALTLLPEYFRQEC